LRTGKI